MNNKNEYICPICGEGTLWTDYTDGFKWGRAYCDRCDCGGPEVRTGYDENIDAPWRANAIKLFVDVVNEHVIKRCEVEGMNKEEAIKWFEALLDYLAVDEFNEDARAAANLAIEALRGPQPDPITGLVPCGCGGEVYPHYQLGWCHESGVQAFEVSTGCDGCGTCTKPRRGHYVNGIDKDDTELASKRDWNTSHGYTDPPLPEVEE